jgi:hypothetical protein
MSNFQNSNGPIVQSVKWSNHPIAPNKITTMSPCKHAQCGTDLVRISLKPVIVNVDDHFMKELAISNRRARVLALHASGYNEKSIAEQCGVHRHTVQSDLSALNVQLFSVISDEDLDELVAGEFLSSHLALGNHALESRLLSHGFRIQRIRLRESRRRLGVVRELPRTIKRLKWYEARGPDGNLGAMTRQKKTSNF